MSFLAPTMLLGGLAIGVPIVLHFFYKARYRKLPWAAMTFLKQAIEQTSRRLRFQELILLALRCIVLLLLAFAIARPTFSGATLAGRGESVDAILVFDTSYSMTARDGEKTRLERAQDAAQTVIDNLPPNSTVQILTVADRVQNLGPNSPGNLDQAKQVVGSITPTSLSSDFLPGLSEAFSALDRGAGTNKEVYLFTDGQKLGFDRQSAAIRAKCDELKQRATLLIVRCGNPERPVRNVAVVNITSPGVDIPHSGTRTPFTVLLQNTGKDPVRNVNVAIEVNGKQLEKEGLAVDEVPPGQTIPVTLTAKLDTAGPTVISAMVSGDDLPGDNRLDRLIEVRDTVRVLIVDGTPDLRDPKESGSHFIRNALLPVSEADLDSYFVRTTVVPAEEAGPALLGVCDLCILANVPASDADRPGVAGLRPEFVERLKEFVSAGGGLLIGAGDLIVPERYNQILGSGGAKLLPFDLEAATSTTIETPYKLAAETVAVPSYLERLRDEPFRTVSADADLLTVVSTKPGDGQVLLRLSDQRPFLSSRTIGAGEVIFVGTSLDARWGNWPAKAGSYVSFLRMTLRHLTTDNNSKETNRTAGEPLIYYPSDVSKEFDLIRPNGERTKLGRVAGGAAGQRVSIEATDTSVAGLYQIGQAGEEPLRGPRFAVSPDLRESDDLTSLSDGEVEQLLGFKPVFLIAGTGSDDSLVNERSKREWTIWILLALFAFAVGESVWGWYCGRAW